MTRGQSISKKIVELISEGEILRNGNEHDQINDSEHEQKCAGWLASALNTLEIVISNENNAYRKRANSIILSNSGYIVHQAVGGLTELLKQLLHDIDLGLLTSLRTEAHTEIFDDFLSLARNFLSEGNLNLSSVIAGVTFEDTIRRLCTNNSISEKNRKINTLINDLKTNGILTQAKTKRAIAAADVRNKAAHAQWNSIDSNDVESCINLTEDIISNILNK